MDRPHAHDQTLGFITARIGAAGDEIGGAIHKGSVSRIWSDRFVPICREMLGNARRFRLLGRRDDKEIGIQASCSGATPV